MTRSFGTTIALEDVDLELRPGEIVGLLRPNGAGKTTAVSIIVGLRRPISVGRGCWAWIREGRRLDGAWAWCYKKSAFRRRSAFARSPLSWPLITPPDRRQPLLERFGLASLQGDRQAHSRAASGGVSLSLALVGRPRVLVLDEPTAGLDAAGGGICGASCADARAAGQSS